MNPNIPEEIEAMAYLIGQSNQIDALMMNTPATLVTNTNTLKKGMQDYIQQERAHQTQPRPQPVYPIPTHNYGEVGTSAVPIPNYVPPIDFPQIPPQCGNSMFPKLPQPKVDDGQLEFNLEPTKVEEIILLLKEISLKLTKQNSMLEKINANQSKEKGISNTPIKLRANS